MILRSLSLFVGTSQCNANCTHCAGIIHRNHAPKQDGIIDEDLIYKTLRECYEKGARSLSISSSGEPTLSPLSVTRTLKIICNLKQKDKIYSPINLYSNGIRIGEDENFCKNYLDLWESLGLTTMYVTVHDLDERKNAKIYGADSYPPLELIVKRIHDANLLMRANLVLGKRTIEDFEKFVLTINHLRKIGVDSISAWPIRNADDKVDSELSPVEAELDKMESWIEEKQDPKFKVRLLREKSQMAYETGQKLTLFPDGTLSNKWCN